MKRKYLIIAALVLFVLFMLLYSLIDYNEKFRISHAEFRLYKIVSIDSASDCFTLAVDTQSIYIDSSSVVGIKLGTELVSVRREGFLSLFQKGEQDKGHVDTISKVEILNGSGVNLSSVFVPSSITYFKVKGAHVNNHSVNSFNNCFVSERKRNIESLATLYNESKFRNPMICDNICFFKVDTDSVNDISIHDLKLRIKFTDGKLIESRF